MDTSVVVAALCSWHDMHEAAVTTLGALLDEPAAVVLPIAVLLESYAVLTRLPAPRRLAPAVVERALSDTFARVTRRPGLDSAGAEELLRAMASRGLAGGTTYDARIAAAARSGGASGVLTLNPGHFVRFGWLSLEVFVPGAEGSPQRPPA